MTSQDAPPVPVPVLGLAGVLGVYDAGAGALRGNHSKQQMLVRLRLLAGLVPAATWPGAAPWGMDHGAASVTSFLARSEHRSDTQAWARDAVAETGVDPLLLLAAAEDAGGPVGSPYLQAVAQFLKDPEHYRLVALADLPYGQFMACTSSEVLNRLMTTRQRWAKARNGFRRLSVARQRVVMQSAGREFQSRLDTGQVDVCGRHLPTDWARAAADAETIRRDVRPWTSTRVWSACSPTGGDDSTPHVRLLRTLFLDPVRWTPGATELTSGQHRVCQARHARADAIMVAVGPQ